MSKTAAQLSPPWYGYFNYLNALFGEDEQVELSNNFDNENERKVITIIVKDDIEKKDAIRKLVPEILSMGNVQIRIDVLTPDEEAAEDEEIDLDTFKAAFKGNPRLSQIVEGVNPWTQLPCGSVIFKKEVIQFYNDDIRDPYGNFNGLAADIARELWDSQLDSYIMFGTEVDGVDADGTEKF